MTKLLPVATVLSALAVSALTLPALTLPAMAQTGCAVAADLGRGITVTFADGSTEIFRQAAPGIVQVTGDGSDGTRYGMQLAQGFHLLEWMPEGDPSGRVAYDYGMPAAAMPLPQPGGGWTVPARVTDSGGARAEAQTHSYGPAQTLMIGTCGYTMIEATIAYATSDNYVESIIYLPELGLSYLLWNESADYARDPIPAVSIRAGK